MFRFAVLGSGSTGNALLVETGRTRILIDNGFSLAELTRRMQAVGAEGPETLDAVVLTHCHGDHISGAVTLSRKWGTPLYASPGTQRWLRHRKVGNTVGFLPGSWFVVGELVIRTVGVSHDAPDTVALRITKGERSLGLCTDLGEYSPAVLDCLRGCDAIMLEANHDPALLWAGPYPMKLKKRVAGRWGHLSNEQAAEVLAHVLPGGTRQVILCHVSENNNSPQCALDEMAALRSRFPHVHWGIAPAHTPAPFEVLETPTRQKMAMQQMALL